MQWQMWLQLLIGNSRGGIPNIGNTKAHFGLLDIPDWYAEFQNTVPRYDDELTAERALWEQLDQPGMHTDRFKIGPMPSGDASNSSAEMTFHGTNHDHLIQL